MVVRLLLVYATGPSAARLSNLGRPTVGIDVGPLVEPAVGHCWADRPLREAQR